MDSTSSDRPSGTVTFLFTDVEGSTGLWAEDSEHVAAQLGISDEYRQLQEAWLQQLGRHDWAEQHRRDCIAAVRNEMTRRDWWDWRTARTAVSIHRLRDRRAVPSAPQHRRYVGLKSCRTDHQVPSILNKFCDRSLRNVANTISFRSQNPM